MVAPLNWDGDKNPSSWKDGTVTTTAVLPTLHADQLRKLLGTLGGTPTVDDPRTSEQCYADGLLALIDVGVRTDTVAGRRSATILVTIDADVQEEPLHREEEVSLRIPKLHPRAQPQGDVESLRAAAELLVAAGTPVIFANRYGRPEKAPALLVELAELLHAPVVDAKSRMNFPNRHKYNHSGRREQALAQADLILALEPVDLWGLTNDVRDLIGSVKAAPLLNGHRGAAPVDRAALEEAVAVYRRRERRFGGLAAQAGAALPRSIRCLHTTGIRRGLPSTRLCRDPRRRDWRRLRSP